MKLDNILKKIISWVFVLLFFLVPLFFLPTTSELFEFNKIILVYLAATLITGVWIARMIIQKRFIFQKTFLFIPLVLFLFSQVISTIASIDVHTSLFGYYSRFNGGLLSTICYLLLFWAFVGNCDIEDVKKVIKAGLISGAIVSIYGILEHFGYSFSCLMFTGKFNVSCWVQDVKNRVFATLGQPNWLAAYLVILSPLTWWLILKKLSLRSRWNIGRSNPQQEKIASSSASWRTPRNDRNLCVSIILSIIMFTCLLFTQSRSGFLGFVVSAVVFWILVFWQNKGNSKIFRKSLLLLTTSCLLLVFVFGSPFPQINKYFLARRSFSEGGSQPITTDTQIVIGGSESSEIRKIVWKGAINIFKHYPLFGSGVETFAYSYYQFRPIEHNYVSEWDFLYNKAHNEYLNYLATTGIFGLGTYLLLIIIFIYQVIKFSIINYQFSNNNQISNMSLREAKRRSNPQQGLDCFGDKPLAMTILVIALFSGWISILITNFFGFSVVVTSLYFFLIPAFIIILTSLPAEVPASTGTKEGHFSLSPLLILPLFLIFYILYLIFGMWQADIYYSQAQKLNKNQDYLKSYESLIKSVKMFSAEPIFQNELSSTLASLAFLTQSSSSTYSAELSDSAVLFSDIALSTSPKNLNLWKTRTKVFYTLSTIDEKYLPKAIEAVQQAIKLSPTDPKLVYNLGLLYGKSADVDKALEYIQKAIDLKPNYADARNALSIYYEDLNQPQKALEQLEYMQKYIDPNSQEIKDKIERLRKKI